MATIIEFNALWTLTDAAAEVMAERNLINKCEETHDAILKADLPIYHLHRQAPEWFGFSTITGAINDAEKAIEDKLWKIEGRV